MTEPDITLVGRSSSHFTRTARIFALELEIPHGFRPVYDLTSTDPGGYAGNPALKVPILVDARGPLYGTENIGCELAHRSGGRDRVVLRGDVADRLVANAEEMVLHAMNTEVTLILSATASDAWPPPPKVRRSLENALAFLEENVGAVCAALPPARLLSFFETALYCVLTHLPFRKIMDVSGYPNLQAFAAGFEARPAARATANRFDVADAA
jgi:glutathione S-transferase